MTDAPKFKDPSDVARFTSGTPWFSYDGGKTWTRTPRKYAAIRSSTLTVAKVDQETGVITFNLAVDADQERP